VWQLYNDAIPAFDLFCFQNPTDHLSNIEDRITFTKVYAHNSNNRYGNKTTELDITAPAMLWNRHGNNGWYRIEI